MSCPAEWQLSAYADAEPGAAGARSLEAHLVGCARCRRRVIALRDEARVLRDLAHERLPAPVPLARAGRGIALGLPISIGVLSLGSFAASAWIESLPRPVLWFAPTPNLGVSRMLVDLLFAVRDNFAAGFDFAFALAALGAVAGVAYLVADLVLRRTRGGARAAVALLVLAGATALAPRPAQAKIEVRQQDHVKLAAGETIEGSLVALGDTVTIEGNVHGDLVALGDTVRVRGQVDGNVFCAGKDVELAANVTGSAHCAGRELRASGATTGSLYAAARDLSVEQGARVGGDLAVACSECRVEGDVARDLLAAGESLVLAGHAGRDVSLHGKNVSFRESARYPGAIDLHLPKGKEADVAPGAVLGQITRATLESGGAVGKIHEVSRIERLRGRLVEAVGVFVVGLVLFALVPGMFAVRVESTSRFFAAIGLGFSVVVVTAIAVVLLLISVVGIPVALIGGLLLASFAFVGPVVVAAVVGRSVMRSDSGTFRDFAIALAVGLVLLGILVSLPGIGGLALFVLVLEGVGLLTLEAHAAWSERRAARAAEMAA